jgi:hypothetical protein
MTGTLRKWRHGLPYRLTHELDGGHAPVMALGPGSSIPREFAIAYLNRCGLVPDDGHVDADTGRNHPSTKPQRSRAAATMPREARVPVEEELAAPAREVAKARVISRKKN